LLRAAFIRVVAALVLVALLPAAASAHGGASPSLVVTVDHVDPGTTVPIIAADFGSDSKVLFSIVAPARSVELGHSTAGPDGHFTAHFALPTDFPLGWANLVATGDDGSSTSTPLLVGPTAGAPPRPGRAAAWWQDPPTLLLAALLIAGGIGLSALLLRSSRRSRPRKRQT
jgi:hypothetical protein